jgi:hypothetical protein
LFQYKNFGISTNPHRNMVNATQPSTTDPCVTPTKEKGEPKTPGAPFKQPVFATRRNAGVKRGRDFEKKLDSVSDKEPKL